MSYFYQMDPIKDFFDQIYVHKPEWNKFSKHLENKFFDQFPQVLTYDVIFGAKMTQYWQFSLKMTYFSRPVSR